MMTNETRVYTMRLPADLVAAIRADQGRDAEHGPEPALTLTEWLLRAARERLAHRQLARDRRRPRVGRDSDGWPLVRVGLVSDTGEGA